MYEKKESFWGCRYYYSNNYHYGRKSRRDCYESYYMFGSVRKGFKGHERHKHDYTEYYSHRQRKKDWRRHRDHKKRHQKPLKRTHHERRKRGTFYRRPRSFERRDGYHQDPKSRYSRDNTRYSKNMKSLKSSLPTKSSKSSKGGYRSRKYNLVESKPNRHHRQKAPRPKYNYYEHEDNYYYYHPGSSERYYGYHQNENYYWNDSMGDNSHYNWNKKIDSDNRIRSSESRGQVRTSKSTKGGYKSPKKERRSSFHSSAPTPIINDRNHSKWTKNKSDQAPVPFNSSAPSQITHFSNTNDNASQASRSKSGSKTLTNVPQALTSHSPISFDSNSTRKKKKSLSRENPVVSPCSDFVNSSRGEKENHPAKSGQRGNKSPVQSPSSDFKTSSIPTSMHTENVNTQTPSLKSPPTGTQDETSITPDMKRIEIDFRYGTIMNNSIVHNTTINWHLDALDKKLLSHMNTNNRTLYVKQRRSLTSYRVSLMPLRSIEGEKIHVQV